MLKYKASYGIQGNDHLPNYYAYADQYQVTNNNGEYAVQLVYKGNPDITWETSYSFNTGFEFTLLNERLAGSLEYFSRKTVDLLYNSPVPPSWGYSSIPMNVGSIINRGMEMDLTVRLMQTKDLYWDINLNATSYANKILDLAEDVKKTGGIKGSTTIWTVGGSLYDAYLREYAGVDEETGEALYYLVDSEGKYLLDSQGKKSKTADWSKTKQRNLGSTLAKVYGGFGTTFKAFGFDVSALFAYQLGGKMYDISYEELMHSGDSPGMNWHKDILKAWTEENRHTSIPRLDAADDTYQKLSSRFLVRSDYLSLNNLTIGYTLPQKLTTRLRMNQLRVYLVGDNLALLTARKGLDPRQALGMTTWDDAGIHNYSALKSLSAGVALTF